jgi:hypothetical protein
MQKGTINSTSTRGDSSASRWTSTSPILGFNGPESHMNYLSRTTREPVENAPVAETAGTGKTAQK